MGPKSRQEWLEAIAPRYRKASKKGKGKILDEFCAVSGYRRKYAIRRLGRWRRRGRPPQRRAGRPPTYGPAELAALKTIWLASADLGEAAKIRLCQTYASLDPFALKQAIEAKLKLIRLIRIGKRSTPQKTRTNQPHAFGVFFN